MLCQELTGESLVEAFRAGNKPLFYYRLRALADNMLIKKVVDKKMAKNTGKSNIFDVRNLVRKRQKQGHIAVQNAMDAEKVVEKITKEEAQIISIKQRLAA